MISRMSLDKSDQPSALTNKAMPSQLEGNIKSESNNEAQLNDSPTLGF